MKEPTSRGGRRIRRVREGRRKGRGREGENLPSLNFSSGYATVYCMYISSYACTKTFSVHQLIVTLHASEATKNGVVITNYYIYPGKIQCATTQQKTQINIATKTVIQVA